MQRRVMQPHSTRHQPCKCAQPAIKCTCKVLVAGGQQVAQGGLPSPACEMRFKIVRSPTAAARPNLGCLGHVGRSPRLLQRSVLQQQPYRRCMSMAWRRRWGSATSANRCSSSRYSAGSFCGRACRSTQASDCRVHSNWRGDLEADLLSFHTMNGSTTLVPGPQDSW